MEARAREAVHTRCTLRSALKFNLSTWIEIRLPICTPQINAPGGVDAEKLKLEPKISDIMIAFCNSIAKADALGFGNFGFG